MQTQQTNNCKVDSKTSLPPSVFGEADHQPVSPSLRLGPAVEVSHQISQPTGPQPPVHHLMHLLPHARLQQQGALAVSSSQSDVKGRVALLNATHKHTRPVREEKGRATAGQEKEKQEHCWLALSCRFRVCTACVSTSASKTEERPNSAAAIRAVWPS